MPAFRIIPVDGTPRLHLSWSTPELYTEWRNKPYRLLSFCIGHEGSGSILALLKSRGWANELSAGFLNTLRDFSIFHCQVTLTPEGLEHWRSILHIIMRYVDVLRSASLPEASALFAESILIEEASFKFQEKQAGEVIVQNASMLMLEYPPEFCHFAQTCYLEKDFRFEDWQRWLAHLCAPEKNMRVHLIASKESHEEQVGGELPWLAERWYKTQYHTQPLCEVLAADPSSPEPISFSSLAALGAAADHQNELHLPPSNPYLPADFRLLPLESTSGPQPVFKAERAVTWAQTEVLLKEPRVSLIMQLQVPWADIDAESYIIIAVMIKCIAETFSTHRYLAEEAKYQIDLTHQHQVCVTSGLRVSVLGFSDKFDAVLQSVCAAIAAPELSPELLEYVLGTYHQLFTELKVSDAYTFCLRPCDHVRMKPWFSEDAKEKALQKITLEKLRSVHSSFMRDCFVTTVICGNISSTSAAETSKLALQTLRIPVAPIAGDCRTPAFTLHPHLTFQVFLKCPFCLSFFLSHTIHCIVAVASFPKS
jgi:insulysin